MGGKVTHEAPASTTWVRPVAVGGQENRGAAAGTGDTPDLTWGGGHARISAKRVQPLRPASGRQACGSTEHDADTGAGNTTGWQALARGHSGKRARPAEGAPHVG